MAQLKWPADGQETDTNLATSAARIELNQITNFLPYLSRFRSSPRVKLRFEIRDSRADSRTGIGGNIETNDFIGVVRFGSAQLSPGNRPSSPLLFAFCQFSVNVAPVPLE